MSLLEDFGHLKPKHNQYHSLIPTFSPQCSSNKLAHSSILRFSDMPAGLMTKGLSGLRHMCGNMELKEKIALRRIHLRKCPSQDVTMSHMIHVLILTLSDVIVCYSHVLASADPFAKIAKSKMRNPKSEIQFWILGAPTKDWLRFGCFPRFPSALTIGAGCLIPARSIKFSGNRCRSAKIASFWHVFGFHFEHT